MRQFLSGAIVIECLVAALFFVRFWRKSHDRLFVFFGVAFAFMAVNWAALAFIDPRSEARALFYLFRLVANVLILVAIVDKNRASR